MVEVDGDATEIEVGGDACVGVDGAPKIRREQVSRDKVRSEGEGGRTNYVRCGGQSGEEE